MADPVNFNPKDTAAWEDRKAQGAAAVSSINNMPYVWRDYTAFSQGLPQTPYSPAQMQAGMYPAQPAAGGSNLASILGINPSLLSALLGGGAGGGSSGQLVIPGVGPLSMAPGTPISASSSYGQALAAQPASFFQGVDPNNVGAGYNPTPPLPGGGGRFID